MTPIIFVLIDQGYRGTMRVTMPESWLPVEREIKAFRQFLRPDFPRLVVEHALEKDMRRDYWKWGRKSGLWKQSGVYLIYDVEGALLYIGKATASFEKRVLTSFDAISDADSLAVIRFPDGLVFMAHALEAFLIARLPTKNKCGANHYVQCTENQAIEP